MHTVISEVYGVEARIQDRRPFTGWPIPLPFLLMLRLTNVHLAIISAYSSYVRNVGSLLFQAPVSNLADYSRRENLSTLYL
ncbi:hypothetical protein PM082_010006 [Marasmius tenuissimus]|nr:hypothetical protein PM082_010006 [Marasmius tenuissimus]